MLFLSLFRSQELRKKILFTLGLVAVYRFGSHIPLPGIDLESIKALFSQGGVLGFFNLFSGGGLSRFSVFALGILPYINASIIIQLLTIVWPKLKEISQEGDFGRKQIGQYTRYLAIALAFFQAIVMSVGFKSFMQPGVSFGWFLFSSVVGLVAGSALVMWLGEIMTEYGIGNGASILIFVGILAGTPAYARDAYQWVVIEGSFFLGLVMLAVFLGLIVSIVFIQEAQREVPVNYAKRVVGRQVIGGKSSFIPLKLIQGGVMPIIFASAILQFPLMFFQYLPWAEMSQRLTMLFAYDGLFYNGLFCFLIFFFTYFYTAITFNPQDIADMLKKNGGFILGIRPGVQTVDYLDQIISKMTLLGASFLALIALVPILAFVLTKFSVFQGLGGTAMLIIVGVAMDLVRQIKGFAVSKRYAGMS
jgi:preprotein translocase subunit SecY